MTEKRKRRCCFTGHRPEKIIADETRVKQCLRREISRAYEDGYSTFISGMSRGVDLWAAQIVAEMKEECGDIRLIAAIPFEGFEQKWPKEWKDLYYGLLLCADHSVVLAPEYSYDCYRLRNRWMVDHSNLLIAYYNGAAGGTENTIQYALRAQINIRVFR